VLILATLSGAGYALTRLSLAQLDSEAHHDPLLSPTRTHLSLCVEGAGGYSISGEDVTAVQAALDEGLAEQPVIPLEFEQREVMSGCPPPSEPLGTSTMILGLYAPHYGDGDDGPSEHRLFVYKTTTEVYRATFGSQPYAKGSAEFVCEGDACRGVTTAVYIPTSASDATLIEALLDGLLLRPRTPNPEPTLDWTACERGEQPHPDYSCDQFEEWQRDQQK
jgi:hypothetical protein